jgi:diguanylate cyclase (GGDEF)-like protein
MMSPVDEPEQSAGGGDGEASLLRARLSAIVDTTLDPLLLARPVHDATGQVIDFVIADMNGSHTRAGGDRSTTARMHLPERSAELFAMYRRVLHTGETEFLRRVWIEAHPDDETSTGGWADVRATAVAGDLVVSWRSVGADVAAENVLRAQALQDPLTHLPNRRGLMEILSAACATPDPFGVLFVDIDQFKPINDQHGHAVGDAVLVAMSRRLAGVLRDKDVVGRLAGDEFVVLARPLHDPAELQSLAQRLLATGEDAHRVGADDLHVTVSVGGLWVTQCQRDLRAILDAADALMYTAKRQGGGQLQVGTL